MVVDFYRPGSSWLHSFDARAKLILLAPAIASFFLPVPFWAVLPALAGSAIIIAITLGPGELLKPLRAIGPVLLLICLLTPPFVPEGKPLVSIFGLALITSTGLSRTFTTLTRFIGITLAFVAVFRSIAAGPPCRQREMAWSPVRRVSGVYHRAALYPLPWRHMAKRAGRSQAQISRRFTFAGSTPAFPLGRASARAHVGPHPGCQRDPRPCHDPRVQGIRETNATHVACILEEREGPCAGPACCPRSCGHPSCPGVHSLAFDLASMRQPAHV